MIELIQSLERPPTKFLKKLVNTDEIWEIRVEIQGNIFRLLSFFDEGSLLIVNHGIVKKSQKTPIKEIKVAQERIKKGTESFYYSVQEGAELGLGLGRVALAVVVDFDPDVLG